MNDRLPPHSEEAERGVLGCLLLAPREAKPRMAKLTNADFYDVRNKDIFTACFCLQVDGQLADPLTVTQWLKDKGRSDDAGGRAYVLALPDATPCVANFDHYLGIVKDKAKRRKALNISTRMAELAYNEAIDPKALIHDARTFLDSALSADTEQREWFRFYSPADCRAYVPPKDFELVGDCHIVRGSVTVIAGPPGVGKSRSAVGLAVAGATGADWLGLKVHTRFKTAIIQNENGRYRLAKEFSEIQADGLDEFIRISDPPAYGMAFDNVDFRSHLAEWLNDFRPSIVVIDPWNSVTRDDKARDYLETFQAIRAVLPKGDAAPALVIIAHTRKPKGDDRKTGRGLLHDVAGSYALVSVPRTVFVMQTATDDPIDDRVVWTCSKNNDGQLGDRSAWYRRNGLFRPCPDFDWQSFDNPPKETGTISKGHLEQVFDSGTRKLARKTAVAELEQLTGCKKTAAYSALDLNGRFKAHLTEDDSGLLCWTP